jgi:cytoskeleton protein RodZ
MSEADAAAEATTGTAGMRPGRTLAEARAARNLTLAEVAQQLKLSATQIEALEADAYERLPGPVFVRGFVRNYARLLELDAEALVSQVELPRVPSPASAAIPLSRNIPFPEQGRTNWVPYASALALVIGAVVLFEAFFSTPPEAVVSVVTPKPTVEPVVVAQPAAPAKEAVSAPATPQPLPPPVETVAVTALAEPVAVPAPTPTAALTPAKPQAGMAELHFVFETNSWVEVRDRNDRILFSQLNPVGAEHRMQGRRPLSLVIGNARGVRLTYNGEPFDLAPYTRVEVARFTLE